MTLVLRAIRLLAIVAWVGGLIFFAFVEAPTAFHVMGTTRQFALLIGGSIAMLNHVGQASGFLFLIATIALWFRTGPRSRRLLMFEAVFVILMLTATMYVQSGIVPVMERDRAAAGGDIAALAADNPLRIHFDHLHALSEKVEGSGLFFGLGIILLMAAERDQLRPYEFGR